MIAVANPCLSHGCSFCCFDTEMPLMQEDVDRLAGLGHDPALFSERDEDGQLRLRTVDAPEGAPGRPCFFLKEGRCSVYSDRPAGCRIFPFVLNESARIVRDEECPHRHEFPMDVAARRRILRIGVQIGRETREAKRGRRA